MSRLREFEDRLLLFAKSKVFHVVLLKRNLYRTDELGIELFPEALTNMHIAVLGELSGVAGGSEVEHPGHSKGPFSTQSCWCEG
jgi:hypothetical protein